MARVDAHVHLLPGSALFQRQAEATGAEHSLPGLLREMDANQVERAVLIAHFDPADGHAPRPFANRTNNDLLALLAQGGERFRGLLTVNVGPEGAVDLDLLEEHLGKGGVAGVKFFLGYEPFLPTDPRCAPVYELLERKRAVAMFHTGDTLVKSVHLKYAHPLPLDEVAVAYPRMPIVIAHAGQHWMRDAGELVGKNPNVHADLSGWFLGRELPWFADFVMQQFQELVFWADGCDKLMFGSDWPLMRMGPYLGFFDRCKFLSDEDRAKMLGENARRLYWEGKM